MADVPLRSLQGIVLPRAPVLRDDVRQDEMNWEQESEGEEKGVGTPRGKRTNNWLVPDT